MIKYQSRVHSNCLNNKDTPKPITTNHNQSQISTTNHKQAQPIKNKHNQSQTITTNHNQSHVKKLVVYLHICHNNRIWLHTYNDTSYTINASMDFIETMFAGYRWACEMIVLYCISTVCLWSTDEYVFFWFWCCEMIFS